MPDNPATSEILRAQIRIGTRALGLQRMFAREWTFPIPTIHDPNTMSSWRGYLATDLNTMDVKNSIENRLTAIIRGEYSLGKTWAGAKGFRNLPITRARAIAREPMSGKTLRKWVSLARKRALLDADKSVRFAKTNADKPHEIDRAIRRTKAALRNNTKAISRMAATHGVSRGHETAWQEEGAHSVQFVAIFDAVTSSICQQQSGKVWKASSPDIKRPPLHPNCRSMLVPIYAEIPPPHFDYESWLRQQPVSVQNHVLGVRRAKLFRSGRSLRSLIGQDGLYKPLHRRKVKPKPKPPKPPKPPPPKPPKPPPPKPPPPSDPPPPPPKPKPDPPKPKQPRRVVAPTRPAAPAATYDVPGPVTVSNWAKEGQRDLQASNKGAKRRTDQYAKPKSTLQPGEFEFRRNGKDGAWEEAAQIVDDVKNGVITTSAQLLERLKASRRTDPQQRARVRSSNAVNRAKAEKSMNELHEIVDGDVMDTMAASFRTENGVLIVKTSSYASRHATAYPEGSRGLPARIVQPARYSRRYTTHEIAHHLEFADPAMEYDARQFVGWKLGHHRAVPVGTEAQNWTILKYYQYKLYGHGNVKGSTEIVSRGMEHLLHNPLDLVNQDPDWFMFLYTNVLRRRTARFDTGVYKERRRIVAPTRTGPKPFALTRDRLSSQESIRRSIAAVADKDFDLDAVHNRGPQMRDMMEELHGEQRFRFYDGDDWDSVDGAELWRGVQTQHLDDNLNGDYFGNKSVVYTQGIYFGDDIRTGWDYAGVGGRNGTVFRAKLHPDAKVLRISADEYDKILGDAAADVRREFHANGITTDRTQLFHDNYIAMQGYDAVEIVGADFEGRSHIVVFNKRAIIVDRRWRGYTDEHGTRLVDKDGGLPDAAAVAAREAPRSYEAPLTVRVDDWSDTQTHDFTDRGTRKDALAAVKDNAPPGTYRLLDEGKDGAWNEALDVVDDVKNGTITTRAELLERLRRLRRGDGPSTPVGVVGSNEDGNNLVQEALEELALYLDEDVYAEFRRGFRTNNGSLKVSDPVIFARGQALLEDADTPGEVLFGLPYLDSIDTMRALLLRTAFHEVGHHIEWNIGAGRAAKQFLGWKVGTGRAKPFGFDDSLHKTEAMKWYHYKLWFKDLDGTEVVSRGLEALVSDPVRLIQTDPDWFVFLYTNVLRRNVGSKRRAVRSPSAPKSDRNRISRTDRNPGDREKIREDTMRKVADKEYDAFEDTTRGTRMNDMMTEMHGEQKWRRQSGKWADEPGTEIFRSVPSDAVEDTLDGSFFGHRDRPYGQGVYFGETRDIAEGYAKTDGGGTIIRGKLHPDAKVFETRATDWLEFRLHLNRRLAKIQEDLGLDPKKFHNNDIALEGFDAMKVTFDSGRVYWVIFNKRAVTVDRSWRREV